MTKTQRRKQKSEEWKEANDWGLSVAERTAKRIQRAEARIKEMQEAGRDTTIVIELLNDVKKEAGLI